MLGFEVPEYRPAVHVLYENGNDASYQPCIETTREKLRVSFFCGEFLGNSLNYQKFTGMTSAITPV